MICEMRKREREREREREFRRFWASSGIILFQSNVRQIFEVIRCMKIGIKIQRDKHLNHFKIATRHESNSFSRLRDRNAPFNNQLKKKIFILRARLKVQLFERWLHKVHGKCRPLIKCSSQHHPLHFLTSIDKKVNLI